MESPTAGQSTSRRSAKKSTRPDEGYSSSSDEENPEVTKYIESELHRYKARGPPNRPAESRGKPSHWPPQIKSQPSDQGVVTPKKRTPATTSSQPTTAGHGKKPAA